MEELEWITKENKSILDYFSNEKIDIVSNEYKTEILLMNKISKINLGAVTDVTDQFVLINLKGNKIFELFHV